MTEARMASFHTCNQCQKNYKSYRADRKYCSDACRLRASRQRRRDADTSTLYGKRCACGRPDCWIGYNNTGGRMTQSKYRDGACRQYAYRQRKTQY